MELLSDFCVQLYYLVSTIPGDLSNAVFSVILGAPILHDDRLSNDERLPYACTFEYSTPTTVYNGHRTLADFVG